MSIPEALVSPVRVGAWPLRDLDVRSTMTVWPEVSGRSAPAPPFREAFGAALPGTGVSGWSAVVALCPGGVVLLFGTSLDGFPGTGAPAERIGSMRK